MPFSASCGKKNIAGRVQKGTIGNVILHSSAGVYFEFPGLSKWQISLQEKNTEDKEYTSTGPLRPGKYFLASSPSPYPFGLSMCSV